ncbi:D-alanyl-D-alanine carboxypeptidase [Streptomyces sp. NPDC101152]|uniref:D-alanyl-D-alanine carboxypeptidase n=1 Tax=Streptomyces sp. NPDC101152 TaxID=3366116 RepID=UPI0037FE3B87
MEEASVAGESPDRSKQRESSAEPTSGSAVPVPETPHPKPDPRLTTTRGGVDTATRAISTQSLRPRPQHRPDPSDSVRETTPDDAITGAEGETAEDVADGSGAEAGARTAAGATDGAAGPESTPDGADGSTGEAAGGRSPATARAAADGVADETADEAEAASGGGSDAAGPAAAEVEAGSDGTSGAREAAADGAEGSVGRAADAVTDEAAGGPAEGTDGGVTGVEVAEGRSGPSEKAAGGSGASEGAEAVQRADGAAEAEAVVEARVADGAVTGVPKSGRAEDAQDADGAGESAEAEAVVEARVADGAVTGVPKSGRAEDAEDADGAGEPAEAEDAGDARRSGSAAEEGDDSPEAAGEVGDARLRAAVAAWVRTGDTDSKDAEDAEDAEDADIDAEPQSGTDTATDAPVDEPAVADGEKAPQGPPAPGDESGTGGAGGKNKDNAPAPGKASGAAPQGPVDQPTAVFKRPKPQVDQPTTMLKIGGKLADVPSDAPSDAPSDPERTSKFVALKPLDEPATRKPADATAPVPQVGPERTTQQPLPPKPPLDLLAELTNTPPPPQTPVRTVVRRVKIWTPLVLLLVLVFAIVQAVRPLPTPTLALTADNSYTFSGSSAALPWPNEGQGRLDINGIGTMGTFGKQTPVPIGSVAKAMTAYIVLQDHPLKPGQDGPKITVDALAEKEGGYDKHNESTLNTVKKGDVLSEKQALSAVMIPSANNIARLLARWDAGSEAAFITKMNDTAKKLGMTGTTYTDASGLKETTVSTASDQVKLGNELVRIPALMDITKLPNWTDPSGQKWRNYNSLVPYDGAIGIKTGTTTKAGGNLLFAATKVVGGETVTVVGAILGQHTAPIIDTVNGVSKTAMLAAQAALKSVTILKKGDVVGYVDDELGGHTPIVATKDVTAVGWSGFRVKLSFAAGHVPHTAKAGTQVGTLTVGDGTSGAVKVPVALQKDLAEPGLTAKLKRLG